MGAPGALLGGSGVVLGRPLAAKGASWGGPGVPRRSPGEALGGQDGVLGSSWGVKAVSWEPPDALGTRRGDPSKTLKNLRFLSVFDVWEVSRAPWARLGAVLGAEGGPRWPKMAPDWSQDGSWEGHGGVRGGPGGVMGRILCPREGSRRAPRPRRALASLAEPQGVRKDAESRHGMPWGAALSP